MSTPRRVANAAINWKEVGRRLRELRGFDTTQQEFARHIGVSQGYVSAAENGDSEIGAEVLLRISRHCGRTIEWVLTGAEPGRRR